MKHFSILTLADHAPDHEVVIANQAWEKLWNAVTPKHRKKMIYSEVTLVNNSLLVHSFSDTYKYIKVRKSYSDRDLSEFINKADIAIIPAGGMAKKMAVKSLERGVPILSYDGYSLRNTIENNWGILIPYCTREENVNGLSEILQQLYYDEGARLFLKKGASEYSRQNSRSIHKKVSSKVA